MIRLRTRKQIEVECKANFGKWIKAGIDEMYDVGQILSFNSDKEEFDILVLVDNIKQGIYKGEIRQFIPKYANLKIHKYWIIQTEEELNKELILHELSNASPK